ncbi:MAG: bifunctional demethylmenaquinone methyltransferase/2-methoxy-6-polyprenyl-1,4-benzoquinol methylase UbiE [Planctomycetota bacterium]
MPEAPAVRDMFARISPRYDRLNRILSMGIDVGWRKQAVRYSEMKPGDRVLDACSGTGDLANALSDAGADVVGSDFCGEMLEFAEQKNLKRAEGRRPAFVQADTTQLPWADSTFDLATVAFGIRNVEDPRRGLAEMLRVVRPGGRVLVLEFCKPRTPGLRQAYMFYFRRVLPRLGRMLCAESAGAYDYLPDSVMQFPEREGFLQLMREAGWEDAEYRTLSGGIAALYRGRRPEASPA